MNIVFKVLIFIVFIYNSASAFVINDEYILYSKKVISVNYEPTEIKNSEFFNNKAKNGGAVFNEGSATFVYPQMFPNQSGNIASDGNYNNAHTGCRVNGGWKDNCVCNTNVTNQVWNGSTCVCPSNLPEWNGSKCYNPCSSGLTWNGSACVCPTTYWWYEGRCNTCNNSQSPFTVQVSGTRCNVKQSGWNYIPIRKEHDWSCWDYACWWKIMPDRP